MLQTEILTDRKTAPPLSEDRKVSVSVTLEAADAAARAQSLGIRLAIVILAVGFVMGGALGFLLARMVSA
jgi:hypothetical protein